MNNGQNLAATYYVSTTGSDSVSCAQAQNVNTPKLTIPEGIACLASGDTLQVRAGTYAGQTITNPPSGSAPITYTTVRNFPDERPKITRVGEFDRGFWLTQGSSNNYIEVSGFEFDGVYDNKWEGVLNFSHHIRFINNIVHDTVATGILIFSDDIGSQGGDHLIQGNEFYNIGIGTPGYVPGMLTIYGTGNRTIVENNTFHDSVHGVGIWPVTHYDVTIRNNVSYRMKRNDLHAWQIGSTLGATFGVTITGGRHLIYNNVCYDSKGSCVAAYCSSCGAPSDVKIFNNTVYNNVDGAPGFEVTNCTNCQVRNNIAYLTGGIVGGIQSNNLMTDPLFVDPAKGDFRVQKGSLAVDRGIVLPEVTTDFAGIRRPQGSTYDIGAYEWRE